MCTVHLQEAAAPAPTNGKAPKGAATVEDAAAKKLKAFKSLDDIFGQKKPAAAAEKPAVAGKGGKKEVAAPAAKPSNLFANLFGKKK